VLETVDDQMNGGFVARRKRLAGIARVGGELDEGLDYERINMLTFSILVGTY